MASFISLFNGERLFGWVVYNLLMAGLVALYVGAQVMLFGNEIVWGGPAVYTYEEKLPAKNR